MVIITLDGKEVLLQGNMEGEATDTLLSLFFDDNMSTVVEKVI